jgi:hypothetical protein
MSVMLTLMELTVLIDEWGTFIYWFNDFSNWSLMTKQLNILIKHKQNEESLKLILTVYSMACTTCILGIFFPYRELGSVCTEMSCLLQCSVFHQMSFNTVFIRRYFTIIYSVKYSSITQSRCHFNSHLNESRFIE